MAMRGNDPPPNRNTPQTGKRRTKRSGELSVTWVRTPVRREEAEGEGVVGAGGAIEEAGVVGEARRRKG